MDAWTQQWEGLRRCGQETLGDCATKIRYPYYHRLSSEKVIGKGQTCLRVTQIEHSTAAMEERKESRRQQPKPGSGGTTGQFKEGVEISKLFFFVKPDADAKDRKLYNKGRLAPMAHSA